MQLLKEAEIIHYPVLVAIVIYLRKVGIERKRKYIFVSLLLLSYVIQTCVDLSSDTYPSTLALRKLRIQSSVYRKSLNSNIFPSFK